MPWPATQPQPAGIRIDTAAGLLTRTGESVTTVAARGGFSTTETLRRAFTTTLGTPPSAYRRTHGTAGEVCEADPRRS